MLQFTGANPRLSQADVIDSSEHLALVRRTLSFALDSLVPSLPADAQEATGPADSQTGDAGLREDLPSRFFARETP